MKSVTILLLSSMSLLFLSCKQDDDTPKVRYESSNKEKTQPKVDTTKILVADLPIHFEGTNFLIHPIGNLNHFSRTSASYSDSSSSSSDQSFSVSNTNDYEITGYLQNLKFQEIKSDSLIPLSKKPLMIETATYLKTIADKNKLQLLIYTLSDTDTNKDGKLDGNDIKSLYISDISGGKFTKLSPDLNELLNWKVIESKSRLYFRTIEDSNKNGAFDKDDKVHYHYVDLLSKELKVMEYNPV
ncbi:MAG: hypothetical protein H7239_08410 [Flavobacterium sp.]|nr:hypothetical protein [Flavobacterium sp.]